MSKCNACGCNIDVEIGCGCRPAAPSTVRSEPLFGTRGWTMDDLKAIAVQRCIELYRGMDSEGLYHAGPLVQALADIGRDACTPHVPNDKLTHGGPTQ